MTALVRLYPAPGASATRRSSPTCSSPPAGVRDRLDIIRGALDARLQSAGPAAERGDSADDSTGRHGRRPPASATRRLRVEGVAADLVPGHRRRAGRVRRLRAPRRDPARSPVLLLSTFLLGGG